MGEIHRIESLNNPHLKKLKRLQKVDRHQRDFLIEGTHLVSEAVATQWPIQSVFYTDQWADRNRKLIGQIPASTEQYTVDAQWLKHAVTTQQPDGIVAIGYLKSDFGPEGLSKLTSDKSHWSLTIATDGVQDPGNAGTLLRSVVALGGNRLFLSPDSVSPIHPKFLRSTAGQWFRSPPGVSEIADLANHAKQMGVQVVVADMGGDSIDKLDLLKPTLFVLGTEGRGVSKRTRELADHVCGISMANGVESLNVAIAGTILLYEASRQRRRT